MAERIASGEVFVGVSDAEAIAGLRNVDREFDRTMRKIDGKEAEAKVSVNLRELKRELKEAEAELDKWRAREKAAETKDQRYYRSQRRKDAEDQVKYLRDQAAMQEKGLGALKDQNKERALGIQRERELERTITRRAREADRMAVQEAKAAAARERAGVDEAKQQELIIRKQREYARAVDQVEKAQRRKKGLIRGTEVREKVELDEKGARLKMVRLKEELNLLGSHPPVKIKVDTDRDVSFMRRRLFQLQTAATGALEKLSSIGHVRLNLGPFSGTIRTMILAVGALSPIISSLTLSLGSLVSVLGAGMAGAGAIGAAGIVGMVGAFGGLFAATRNTKQEITNARTAINGLQKAQEQYGKNSDQAKKKQQQLNQTLKSISPLARETALGMEKFFSTFDKHTGPTRKNLGAIAKSGFDALNKLTPMWASHTNKLSDILRTNLSKGFDWLGKGPGKNILSDIMANFNRSLPAALRGLGDFGRAFLNISHEGSKFLPMMTRGFEGLGRKLLAFTQRSNFGDVVKGWVNDARDVVRFFGAASRVLVHFFSAGTSAGDGFLKDMTAGLNRWDDFLTSKTGKDRLGGMFQEGVKATEELGHALGPILQSFSEWSTAMAPITAGILHVVAGISKIVGTITHVIALKGAFAALGETIAIAFAVSKIAGFVNMLIKAYDLVKAISVAMAAESLAGGGFLAQAGAGLTALRAGKGASTLAAGAEAGAAAKVAGAGQAAEKAAGQMALFEGEAAAVGESAVAAGAGAEAAGAGIGLAGTAAAVALPAVIAVGGAYLIYKHHIDQAAKSVQGLLAIDDKNNAALQAQISAENDAAKTHDRYAAATRGVHRAEKDVATARGEEGKKGVHDLIDAEARLYDQRERQTKQRSKFITDAKQASQAVKDQVANQHQLIQKRQEEMDAARKEVQAEENVAGKGRASAEAYGNLAKATSLYQAELNTLRGVQARATTAAINHQRALAGVGPIAQSAAMQVGFFAQQFGKLPNVKKILLTANTGQLEKIASLSKQVNSSVGQKATKNILVNARSADDAISKLKAIQAFELQHKNLTVSSPSAGKTLVDLAKIEGVKLNPKTVKAAVAGDRDVIKKLAVILGIKLPDKKFKVQAFADQAKSAVQNIIGLLAGIHDKSYTITEKHVQVGAGTRKAMRGATGNVMTPEGKRQNNIPASMSERTTGGRYQKPTFLVGEEKRPEFVIATNPAYRQQNINYWMMAAKHLGIPGFAGGGFTPGVTPYDSPADPTKIGGYGYQASFDIAPPPGKPAPSLNKKRKKQIKKAKKVMKLSKDNPWGVRVNQLLAQQDKVEREIGLREEAQMEEPSTFLKQDGVDANGDPKYVIDDTAVTNFYNSFKPIIDARNALIQVVQALVTAIPQAINWSSVRKATADKNADILLKAARADNKRIKNKEAAIATERKAKHPNQTKIKNLQSDIKKLRDRMSKEKSEHSKQVGYSKSAASDLSQLRDQGVEAGFDYRDAVIQRDAVVAEQAGIKGTADQQLKDTLPTGNQSDNTGPTSDVTYGADAQAYLADQAKFEALRSYGSNYDVGQGYGANVDPNSGVIVGLGQTVNPSIMGGPNAVNQALSGGASGAGIGGSIGGALASGAAAGRMVASSPLMALGAAASPDGSTAAGAPTVNIVNNFETQPADPHTWSQGVAFEMAAAI